jgi:hypothetical protein
MSVGKDPLTGRLSRSREINITVTGRKSGRAITIPVWFVVDGEKLYLLPVMGSDTQSSRTRRFRSMPEVRRLNARSFPSPTPNRYRRWSRNSVPSTGRAR